MKAFIESQFDKYRPMFEKGGKMEWAWPLWEGNETVVLQTGHKTHHGSHVRDPMDMKRLMIFVLYALLPCMFVGMYNIGYQAYFWEGVQDPSILQSILRGGWHMLPIIITSYVVGGIAELIFCVVRKHEINEGFLVTAMLFPLTLAPTTPLWIVGMGVAFGVVIGKEVFGGVGYNILNPALTARAFVFFAYPKVISGAYVWDTVGTSNPLATAGEPTTAYTGATALLAVANAGNGAIATDVLNEQGWSWLDLFLGFVPGSMGETSALAAALGGLFIIVTGIASWRTIVGCIVGLLGAGAFVFFVLGNGGVGGEDVPALFTIPPWYHLVMGSFAFGAIFMATDPVSSSATKTGRWIYGIGIGALVITVRVFNPAYPEGVMLAILFMNVFAPLIDYYVVNATKKRRAARMAAAA